jgi:peptidoglycan-associated lipoprotein
MRNRVHWLTFAAALVALVVLAGCGGTKPEAEVEPTPPPETATDTTDSADYEVQPLERDESVQYVDPNVEYASVFRAIHFEFNRYRILEEAKPTLEEIATLLKGHTDWKVLIEGHCDERGTNEYNLTLGEQRAQSTKRYLTSLGIAEERFQTISYGEERPVDRGHDEEAWARNRRAEFRVEAPGS